ncbi:hypothetical protein [Novosphingobium sp. TCA1]|jgi:hypothetical protein|uniref:hypothetical protein n=1 Tax=Novosphingobium sp. TCA1 TaxID=2682474 RepID=UPI00130C540C|nr:hypothetical protein [Novosphingobium sp. TCA1]GFE72399.1 hypothetical protein NTCA1_00480 [Novosphingobium sp. TCA1]
MLLNNTELSALADYLVCEIDCSAEYEDDQFAVTFSGVRCYVERYRDEFRVEVGHEDDVVFLPRI